MTQTKLRSIGSIFSIDVYISRRVIYFQLFSNSRQKYKKLGKSWNLLENFK